MMATVVLPLPTEKEEIQTVYIGTRITPALKEKFEQSIKRRGFKNISAYLKKVATTEVCKFLEGEAA